MAESLRRIAQFLSLRDIVALGGVSARMRADDTMLETIAQDRARECMPSKWDRSFGNIDMRGTPISWVFNMRDETFVSLKPRNMRANIYALSIYERIVGGCMGRSLLLREMRELRAFEVMSYGDSRIITYPLVGDIISHRFAGELAEVDAFGNVIAVACDEELHDVDFGCNMSINFARVEDSRGFGAPWER
jgi:hypothetical protein